MPLHLDHEILSAALLGYQQQHQEIEARMADLRRRLGGLSPAPAAAKAARKRRLSPEGRARIIAATKRRWAAVRKAKAKAARMGA